MAVSALRLDANQRERLKPYASALVLVPLAAYFVVVPYGASGWTGSLWFLTHSLNLLPHEAGHFFFHFFGTFLGILGGSLLQVLFPCLFAWFFLTNDGALGLQLSLLWLGQNLLDVAAYAADAQARSMPLLGGLGPEAHDWYNILSMLGWLEYTPLVAGLIYAAAFPVWALMVMVPRWVG